MLIDFLQTVWEYVPNVCDINSKNSLVTSKHVPGELNDIADHLSRLQLLGDFNYWPQCRPIPSPRLEGHFLEVHSVVQELWNAFVAPTMHTVYQAGFNYCLQFLLLSGVLSQIVLSDMNITQCFVAHYYHNNLSVLPLRCTCGVFISCV